IGTLERFYNLGLVLANVRALMKEGGQILCRMCNGLAVRNVYSDPVHKIVGLTLLPPEAASLFGKNVRYYYHSWSNFLALLNHNGFTVEAILDRRADEAAELTQSHLRIDARKVKRQLRAENFEGTHQFKPIRVACLDYLEQLEQDVLTMSHADLFHQYRTRFWEFVLRATR